MLWSGGCLLAAALTVPSQTAVALERVPNDAPYMIPSAEKPVRVDAVLDDVAWNGALTLELTYEVSPGENVPAPVRTEVLLTYDDTRLYAAFRAHDPAPGDIRAHFRDRDDLGGDDWVGVKLDTFNDQRHSFNFVVTAAGVQYDSIESPGTEDAGWDTIWDAASTRTDSGFVVEVAIPFSSLRFQRTVESQVWGFDAVRRYPRDHDHLMGLFPRDRSNNCYLCQASKMAGFGGVTPGRNIEISPTLIGIRSDARSDIPDGALEKRTQTLEPGVTGRWGMTPNLTLGLTGNPDFSQVEADALQLDINEPFALFYPERRLFFTEGSDHFATLKNVVYTRTVRDPSWGTKLTGKEGSSAIGAFVVRDRITNLLVPGTESSQSRTLTEGNTSAAVRYRHDVGSRHSMGLLATSRESRNYFNRTYGFDVDLRPTSTNQIQLLVLGSRTRYPATTDDDTRETPRALVGHLASFEYDHTTRTWGWWADYEDVGDGFRADLGFVPRVGYRNVEGGWSRSWVAQPSTWWSRVRLGGEAHYLEDRRGRPQQRRGGLWMSFQGGMQSSLFLEGSRYRSRYNDEEFDLGGLRGQAGFRPTRNVSVRMSGFTGTEIDFDNTRRGRQRQLTLEANLDCGQHLRLGVTHSYEDLDVADEDLYTANVTRISAAYQFSVRAFIRTIVQHVHYDRNPDNYDSPVESRYDRLSAQLLFSYKVNPRTVLLLGYSGGARGDDDAPLTQTDRTFFAKMGYAWVP